VGHHLTPRHKSRPEVVNDGPTQCALGCLQAAGDVRCLVEHGNNHWWRCGRVGNPVSSRLDPRDSGAGEPWIGTWGGQPGGRVAFNPALGVIQCGHEAANRCRAVEAFVMTAERGDLASGPRRVFNQRGEIALPFDAPARFASMRAMLSRSSRMTSSPGTVETPAASSARLSSRASAQPGGASDGGDVSSMQRR
jgi:hypothetical protein